MTTEMGKVASLWRYPVKSMQGEELSEGEITQHGLLGDQAYALIDVAEGKAVSAKNPVKWPTLFGCKAVFAEPPKKSAPPPPVRITLHDGSATESHARDCHQMSVKIGDAQLTITGACGRCVMTTLAQGDLPKDNGILRTAVQHNAGHVGVYAKVVHGGAIKRGDRFIAVG